MRPVQLADAWGEWLSTFEWDAWATLTFREEYSHDAASRAWGRYTAWMAREGNPRLGFFVGHEVGRLGRVHLHALLGGLEETTSRRALWKKWHDSHGRAQILPYDPDRGAAFYVAKYVTKGFAHYDIEPVKPAPAQGNLYGRA